MVTVKDIAKYVGLSQSTVSIVLRGEAKERKISQSTQQKILDAARDLGYRVNLSARKLRATDDNIYIAVYWTVDFRSYNMVHFFHGLWAEAKKSDKKIEFIVKPYEKLEEVFDVNAMYHAAIVCNASDEDMTYLESLQCFFPVVVYNRNSDYYDTVCVDYQEIGQMAANILAESGCRKTLLVTPPQMYRGMKVMENSFLGAAARNQLEVIITEVKDGIEGGQQAAENWINRYRSADSIFSASAEITEALLNSLIKRGIKIPDELKILTMGNKDPKQDETAIVSLSAIYNQRDKLAAKCLDIILMKLNDNKNELAKDKIAPMYVKRKSC